MKITVDFNLVLNVAGGEIGLDVIVGVGRILTKRDGRLDDWIGQRRQNRSGAVVEEAGASEVVGQLSAQFCAGKKVVANRSG